MTQTVDLRAELLRRRLSGEAAPQRVDRITRAARTGPLPVSFAQRRMWLLDQFRPGGTEYLMTTALRLRGPLDPAALRAALDGLVARHEVLRTRYVVVDGEPTQVVDEASPVALAELDLSELDQEAQDRRLTALTTVDREPVDLAEGPVFRAELVRLAAAEHVLVLTVHHIASDGWSEEVLVRELAAGYTRTALAVPDVQYADFAVWQREHRSATALTDQLTYWRNRLAGLSTLELPTDRPRPPLRDATGDRVPFTVPADIAGQLATLGRERGATPFMVLLAAFQVLLSRYSGQTDVAVGTPVAGRDRPEVQDLVGLFLNTLVLRTDLSGEQSFVDVLQRVRAGALDAYANQELPFERIVDALSIERDPSRNPLFDTMFLWMDGGGTDVSMGGLAVEELAVGETTAKFDLTLAVSEQPDGSLAAGVDYATALFDRTTIERLTTGFVRLLASILATPDAPVRTLPLLSDTEERLLLVDWNDTTVAYPVGTLPEQFAAQVARTPDAVAMIADGVELSYVELDRRANRLAHHLIGLGVGPESVVGVRLDRGADLVVALLGIHKAGGAYLPLDMEYPAERTAYLCADSGAVTVVTEETFATLDGRDHDPGVEVLPEHPAYVIYTSGSTGRPKGVIVEHRGIVNRLRWMQDAYRLDGSDRVLQKTPYSFDVSVWEFFWPLITGATLVMAKPGGHRDPAYLAATIADEEITTVHFVPSMLRAFLAEPGGDLPTLRRMICSGEALTADLVAGVHHRFGSELHNLYGPTEASVDVTAIRCRPGEPVTIGRPIANTRTYVLDADLRPTPIGVPGELMLAGVQLARGYLGRPDLTAERFCPNPFGDGERLYRTGDLARYRPDGTIEYLGRLDHQVKIRGQRIEPGEIEAVLTEHPEISAAAVTVHNGQLVAHVTPDTVDLAAVRDFLRAKLTDAMIPTHWSPSAALPLTASGKVDRKALPAPDSQRSAIAGEFVAPRTATEDTIARAIAAAVGVDKVGVHDRFFQIGGDSIRAVRVVGALREQGVRLTVQDLFRHQTVAELVETITLDTAGETPPVGRFELIDAADRDRVPAGVVDAYPLSMVQAGMTYEMLSAAGRTVYQNVSCYQIRDDVPFDLAALRESVGLVVARHEILRTSFDLTTFSETMQLVHESADVPITYTDLRGVPADERDAAVTEFLKQERATPFDLSRAPLLRYRVHQISETEWWLTHTECHAILDGWSHTSVIAEVVASYRALRHGRRPELPPPPPVRFADFVAAEREVLESQADKDFWAAKVEHYDKIEMPDGWRTAEPDTKATIIEVPWDDLEPGLRGLAEAAGTSMKSVLFTAHLMALGLVTGRTRFSTGLVCNGRVEMARGDEVLGMYLNTVPFGAELAVLSMPTWRDLVRSVFAGEVELWGHRRFPLSAMKRGRSGALIDVTFTYLDFHVLGWENDNVGMFDDFSPSEFALEVWTFPGVFRLGGLPSRVPRAQLRLLGRAHRLVLEAMAADPDGATSAVEPADHAPALRGDDIAYPATTVPAMVAAQAPDAVAVRFADRQLTYAELDGRANQVAHHLLAAGVGPESIVGVSLPRGLDLVVALLGVLKAGGAYLPLDPDYPAERLAYMRADSGACLVLDEARMAALAGGPTHAPVSAPTEDDAAYVIYTSGSTGRPKGVHIGHRALANFLRTMAETPGFGADDTLLAVTTVGFDIAALELFLPLVTGGTVHLVPAEVAADGGALRELLDRVRPTVVQATPATWTMLVTAGWHGHLGLRVFCGGEALHADLAGELLTRADEVWNLYGPTEATVWLTASRVRADTPVTLGRPIANSQAYVVGTDLRPVPAGVPGELVLGGVQLARGYLNRPELTAEKFVPDPFGEPGGRLYRTGDLARRELDGTLTCLGRLDHQVKVRGHRIELGEIEATLTGHPEISQAAVVVHDGQLVGYLTPESADLGAVEQHLRGRLPDAMVPTRWLLLDTLPLTASGKIDRASLPAPDQRRAAHTGEYVPPRNTREQVIADTIAAAVRVDKVGIHDDFFRIGGHSLAVMRVITTLRARHGIELTFRSFVERRTVAGLAAPSEHGPPGAMMWIRRAGSRVPLFCVHPGGGSAHWYLRLAEYLDTDQPVAAFEWPGPHDEPVGTESMAERYVAELKAARPDGPYRLLSWCGGSGIATEMARRLAADGDEVTFLLLDPVVDAHQRADARSELALIERLEGLLDDVAAVRENRAEILELLEHLVDDVDEDFGLSLPEDGVGDVWPRAVRTWREVMAADLAYRHRSYPGRLHLIVSDELSAGEHEVAYGQTFDEYRSRWRALAGELTEHRVPGDHFSVMKPPHVTRLAEVITGVLAEDGTEGNPTT